MTKRSRNTRHRVETYDLLWQHAASTDPPTVRLSNRVIRDLLANQGSEVTLPAVTARLQSLERAGNVSIHYQVGAYGRVTREIRLLSRPSLPHTPRLEAV